MEEKDTKVRCHFCGHELIWGGDHDMQDVGYDEEGIVTNMSCSNDECQATWIGYLKYDKED